MNPTGRRLFLASTIAVMADLSASGQVYVPKQSDRPEPATGDEPGADAAVAGVLLLGVGVGVRSLQLRRRLRRRGGAR